MDQVIKGVHGQLVWRLAPGLTVEIVDIEIPSEHRGKGLGRNLLEQLFRRIATIPEVPHQGKYATVYCFVRADNEMAQEFYEHCHFKVLGVLRQFYTKDRRGVDAIVYGRQIEGAV